MTENKKRIILGIDLGTTNSAVAIYEDGKPKIYNNKQGKRTTPSVIALKKTKDKASGTVSEEWIVGDGAKNQTAMNTAGTFYGVKRLIGRRFNDPEVAKMQALASYKIVAGPNGDAWVEVDGQAMAPAEISAKILRTLKEAVEKELETVLGGEKITEAIITVPAYFNDAQRKATIDAGAIAGLDVLNIINEPTAAALAYGLEKKQGGKVAVFDLGGGTFDVSILEIMHEEGLGNQTRVLSTNGDTFLGGENFDEAVTEYIVAEVNKEHGTEIDLKDPASKKQYTQVIQRLREAAEKAKIQLSHEDVAEINLPFLMPDSSGEMINFSLNMTRKQLETLLKSQIEKTLEPCKKALADAGLKASDLDEVILVGGQTRMPLVIETVKNFFGKTPRCDVNPDEIVAMGASAKGAVISGELENVILQDVTPLSIGIRGAGDVMYTLIPRNTPIPAEGADTFSTAKDNQTNVEVIVYQGERAKASENNKLGVVVLDLVPAKKGIPQVKVTLHADQNGVLTVTAVDENTKRAVKAKLEANGGLSKDQVEQMLKDAEVNAEKDRLFRESIKIKSEADSELKDAAEDVEKEYFVAAPDDLKKSFNETVEELTRARKEDNVGLMAEKTKALSEIRSKIGEAFYNAASNQQTDNQQTAEPAPEETKPDAAAKDAPKPPSA